MSRIQRRLVLQLRFQGKAIALSRLMDSAMKELSRLQARATVRSAALPGPIPAPRPQRAPDAVQPTAPTPAHAAGRQQPMHRENPGPRATAAPLHPADPALDRMIGDIAARAAAGSLTRVA